MMTVNERARRIATFRSIEVTLMEMAARWTPLIPEMEVKVMLGRHIWNLAQNADWLGKRTFELRQPMHYTLEPSEGYRSYLEDVAASDTTAARIGALYRALLPGLIQRYRDYLEQADEILDGPSIVAVERVVDHHEKMIREAEALIEELDLEVDDALISSLRENESKTEELLAPKKELAS